MTEFMREMAMDSQWLLVVYTVVWLALVSGIVVGSPMLVRHIRKERKYWRHRDIEDAYLQSLSDRTGATQREILNALCWLFEQYRERGEVE